MLAGMPIKTCDLPIRQLVVWADQPSDNEGEQTET